MLFENFDLDRICIIDLPSNENMKNIKVAIVEDVSEIREGIKYVLDYSEGFDCAGTFSDAESALLALLELDVDIVLMDIHLPLMSGIECLRQVKAKRQDLLFLMFSVFENDENIFEALKAGANGYILKKTPPHKVLEAIKDLAEGGSPMSAVIAKKVIAHFQHPIVKPNFSLSPRETEILNLLSNGFFYKEIADSLGTSTGTVRQQIHKIYEKLHVQNRTEALNKYKGFS